MILGVKAGENCFDNFLYLKENADVFDIDNKTILVSSVKDLIIAKKSINPLRDKDIFDLKQLEAIEYGKI